MRRNDLAEGEYYHIYNRGNRGQEIFIDDVDRARFLFLVTHFQSSQTVWDVGKRIKNYHKEKTFNVLPQTIKKITDGRCVHLVNFAIMGNHFHLTLFEKKENGISNYMHRVQMAYAKYFNTKYKKVGHLFEGAFHSIRVRGNTQLLHLSAYIHKNPRDIREWRGHEHTYPWSSYQDYLGKNRWGSLLQSDIVRGQFSTADLYKKFVDESKKDDFEEIVGSEHSFED